MYNIDWNDYKLYVEYTQILSDLNIFFFFNVKSDWSIVTYVRKYEQRMLGPTLGTQFSIIYLHTIFFQNSVQSCHPVMHKIVAQNVAEYIRPNPDLRNYFQMLRDCDKKLFLVTNSPYHFV